MPGHFGATVGVLVVFLIAGAGQAEDKVVRVADLPREFTGTYLWSGGREPYALTLKITKVEEKGAYVHFSGTHIYMPGDYHMKVTGTIDPKKRTINLRESEPSKVDTDTSGSFLGTISKDLQSIEATWTSREIGKRGILKMKARKDDE